MNFRKFKYTLRETFIAFTPKLTVTVYTVYKKCVQCTRLKRFSTGSLSDLLAAIKTFFKNQSIFDRLIVLRFLWDTL